MGPEVIGLINWTMAAATILLIFAKFGVDGASSRLISEFAVSDRSAVRRIVRDAFNLRLLFTLPVAVLTYFISARLSVFFHEEMLTPLFKLASLLIIAVSFNELAGLMVLGLKAFKALFVMRFAMLVLKVSLVFLAARLALGPMGVLAGYITAAALPAIGVLALLFSYRAEGERQGTTHTYEFSKLIKLSSYLAVSGASVTIYSLLDKLMLGYFKGAIDVGLYSMARNMVETSLFPTFALIMTLRPALAQSFTSHRLERSSYLINRSIRSSFVYSMVVAVVFFTLSRPLMVGLFGPAFAPSARLLVLFLPLIVMRCVGAVILPGLIAADRAGSYAILTSIGAILNFAFNYFFIPIWGAGGAVAATLLSYLPIELIGFVILVRAIPGSWSFGIVRLMAGSFAVSALFAVLFRLSRLNPTNLVEAVAYGTILVVVLFASFIVLKIISKEEIDSLFRPLIFWSR